MIQWHVFLIALTVILSFTFAAPVGAQQSPFVTGPVIKGFGRNATVEGVLPVPKDMHYRVSFDVADGAEPGQLSRSLNTPARFINMMARAGVSPEHLEVAVVIHGSAVMDVTLDTVYESRNPVINTNKVLVEALQNAGVRFYVCGQSAMAQGVKVDDLLPGVDMVLSAITAHAVLGNEGYRPNPF